MTNADKSLGRWGEDLALEWLQKRGMALRERNWRYNRKEIDLIMESDKWLHIVEVKTLTAPSPIEPWEQVTPEKQRNLAYAAEHYIHQARVRKEVHFDIVSIMIKGEEPEIQYIPEAFYPIY